MKTYVTKQGDIWDHIAYILYPDVGREMCMAVLLDANQRHRDVAIFPSGVELQAPEIDAPIVSSLPPWKKRKF